MILITLATIRVCAPQGRETHNCFTAITTSRMMIFATPNKGLIALTFEKKSEAQVAMMYSTAT